ncbi:hypothetical protein BDZ89DRAFT_1161569 [Hymenopellis radicata]|nr:hypothetical protein BDZ89DRAFT_1161569 [Hymenopellis radicata]
MHICNMPPVYIWDNPDYDEPVEPQQALVERGEPRADVDVPSRIWFLPDVGPASTTIMIRQEYHEILLGLLQWMEHQMALTGLGKTRKQEESDVDLSTSPSWLEQTPAPGDLGVVHASPLSDTTVYPNPFAGKTGVTCEGGLVLTGLPGIGKSCFLWAVFNLRAMAGLPTLYVAGSPSSSILWKASKAYRVDLNNIDNLELQQLLPIDTWCLVDSHAGLVTVPQSLVSGDRFIIQAASPRMGRMQWKKKVVRTYYFIMKPWDIGELIAGRQCQRGRARTCHETQLVQFYNLYGGSARDAYFYAPRMEEFEESLSAAFDRLETDSIRHSFRRDPSLFVPESTSHLLLSYFPVDDRKRTVWTLDSPSPPLLKRLLSRINSNYKEAQKAWFLFNLGSSSPGCRAVAAHMFDGFYHQHLTSGGSWALRRMVADEDRIPRPNQANRGWKTVEETEKILVANKVISIEDHHLASSPVTVPEFSFDEWSVHVPLLLGVYHHPTQRTFSTFDSFYVDKIGHAVTFQASISKGHGASPSGKAWLEARGISRVTYVYVTPRSGQDSVSLPLEVDSNVTGFYDSIYHMHLDYEAKS